MGFRRDGPLGNLNPREALLSASGTTVGADVLEGLTATATASSFRARPEAPEGIDPFFWRLDPGSRLGVLLRPVRRVGHGDAH